MQQPLTTLDAISINNTAHQLAILNTTSSEFINQYEVKSTRMANVDVSLIQGSAINSKSSLMRQELTLRYGKNGSLVKSLLSTTTGNKSFYDEKITLVECEGEFFHQSNHIHKTIALKLLNSLIESRNDSSTIKLVRVIKYAKKAA